MINEDLNNNGIPDWAESFDRKAANKPLPEGEDNDFAYEYDNEEAIKQYIPNFREYKWYQQPDTKKYYSYGEKLEDKIESGEIAPEQLPEGSDIQKEAEQLYDDNPYNDEVNNEVISKVDFDKLNIDEIEKIDSETINDGKPYMTVANDIGLEEEDLFYFEQPEFIENLTPKQVEEVKKEPDKQKKIELLKTFSRNYKNENIGDIEYSNKKIDTPPIESATGNSFSINDNPNITSKIRKAGSFLEDIGIRGGSISAGDVSDFSIDNNSDDMEQLVRRVETRLTGETTDSQYLGRYKPEIRVAFRRKPLIPIKQFVENADKLLILDGVSLKINIKNLYQMAAAMKIDGVIFTKKGKNFLYKN